MSIKTFTFLLLFLFSFRYIFAQTPDRVKFTPLGNIIDMTYNARHGLFVVGEFADWGINTGTLALLNQTNDTPDTNFPRIYDRVTDATPDGNGGWFASGQIFTSINENDTVAYSFTGIIHIKANNTIDQTFRINATNLDWQRSIILKICRWRNTVFAIGAFTFTDGTATALLAFDATTGSTKEAPIISTGRTENDLTNCLVYGNTLYLAGRITGFNNSALDRSLIAIDLTTNALKNWGSFQNTSTTSWGGTQNIVASNGKLLVGYTSSSGSTGSGIAAFDTITASSSLWQRVGSGGNRFCANDQYIFFTNSAFDGSFNIGSILVSNGQNTPGWSAQANTFKRTCSQCATNASNLACTPTTVYVQGDFDKINSVVNQKYVGALTISTNTLSSWHPKPSGPLDGFYRISGNTILAIGANGVSYKTQARNKAALLNPITGEPTNRTLSYLPADTDQNSEYRSTIRAVATKGDTLWVGGSLTGQRGISAHLIQTGDTLTKSIVKFYSYNNIGTVQQLILTNIIEKLVAVDSLVYVAGRFDQINSSPRQVLAAVSVKGNLQPFSITLNSNHVNDFKVVGDLLYLSGDFTVVNGVSRKHLACVNRFTGQLTNWNPDPDQPIKNIEVTGQHIIFSAAVSRVGSFTDTQGGRLRNFVIDQNTGQVVKAWGNYEAIRSMAAKDQFLLTSFNENAPCTTSTANPMGISYFNLEYGKYAKKCIIHESYTATEMTFAGQQLFFLPKRITLNNSSENNIGQILMQVRFPSGFFKEAVDNFPKIAGNAGSSTIYFYGYKLGYGTRIALTKSNQPTFDVPINLITFPESFVAKAQIDFTSLTVGYWNIKILYPDGTTDEIPNGVEVIPVSPPDIQTELIGPSTLRLGRAHTYVVEIKNKGESDAYLVPIWIRAPRESKLEYAINVVHLNNNVLVADTLSYVQIDSLDGNYVDSRLSGFCIGKIAGSEIISISIRVTPLSTPTSSLPFTISVTGNYPLFTPYSAVQPGSNSTDWFNYQGVKCATNLIWSTINSENTSTTQSECSTQAIKSALLPYYTKLRNGIDSTPILAIDWFSILYSSLTSCKPISRQQAGVATLSAQTYYSNLSDCLSISR